MENPLNPGIPIQMIGFKTELYNPYSRLLNKLVCQGRDPSDPRPYRKQIPLPEMHRFIKSLGFPPPI